jgi:hypothetical protein
VKYEPPRGDDLSSANLSLFDAEPTHAFLKQASCAEGLPIKNSQCFGVYKNRQPIGWARVFTAYATAA